jgi:hypothetical protein
MTALGIDGTASTIVLGCRVARGAAAAVARGRDFSAVGVRARACAGRLREGNRSRRHGGWRIATAPYCPVWRAGRKGGAAAAAAQWRGRRGHDRARPRLQPPSNRPVARCHRSATRNLSHRSGSAPSPARPAAAALASAQASLPERGPAPAASPSARTGPSHDRPPRSPSPSSTGSASQHGQSKEDPQVRGGQAHAQPQGSQVRGPRSCIPPSLLPPLPPLCSPRLQRCATSR